MSQMSYGAAMQWLAERQPEQVAIHHEGRRVTRAALERRANQLARSYQKLGVGEGSLVTVALPNGVELFEACLAIWRLGATPNPVSHHLPEIERSAIIELADPALVLGAEPGSYGARPCLAAGSEPDPASSGEPLPDRLPASARAMTSGGSTGRPKVILDLSPAQCDPEVGENQMRPDATTLVPGPLYHAGPFITAWQQLLCGGGVVVMSRFDARESLELIAEHGVEWVLFVPTMMQRIWKLPEAERAAVDLSSLRVVMCSGAASPPWLKRAWIGWLGPEKIFEAYGGSERIAGTMISGTEWLAHPGSVGRPTGDRKVKILRADGSPCDPREVGELYMLPPGGQGSTYRYVGAEPTATPDGWESLGDLGYFDEDGYLYLVDRKTDMIVTGGANVYPAEVEAALDAFEVVRSSAVIGLPDDDLGQRIHAIVDTAGASVDEAALRAHLAEHLSRYKIPRSFEYVVEPLRDDAGKVRRSALRAARSRSAP